jgi:hypothetical protein
MDCCLLRRLVQHGELNMLEPPGKRSVAGQKGPENRYNLHRIIAKDAAAPGAEDQRATIFRSGKRQDFAGPPAQNAGNSSRRDRPMAPALGAAQVMKSTA